MIVKITEMHSHASQTYRGSADDLRRQLLIRYPWAAYSYYNQQHDTESLDDLLFRIGTSQNLSVEFKR